MSWRFYYSEMQSWGEKEQNVRERHQVEQGPGGRLELGSSLPVTWQDGSCLGESSAEEMIRWNWEGVWSYRCAKEWRRKESESKWSINCADRREIVEKGRKLLGCLCSQLSDSQDKCLHIRAQGESACKHALKTRLSLETFLEFIWFSLSWGYKLHRHTLDVFLYFKYFLLSPFFAC